MECTINILLIIYRCAHVLINLCHEKITIVESVDYLLL